MAAASKATELQRRAIDPLCQLRTRPTRWRAPQIPCAVRKERNTMTERKVVPHTRDCASHWDGECDCAPKDREELEAMNLASHRDVTRWRQRWEEMRKERDEARAKAREMWTFSSVSFARIAEEMGALGIRVEKPDEIGPALRRALAADRPVVVDDETPQRRKIAAQIGLVVGAILPCAVADLAHELV